MDNKCRVWKTNPTKEERRTVATCNCDGCVGLLAVEMFKDSDKQFYECVLKAKEVLDGEVLSRTLRKPRISNKETLRNG